jgi:purine-binding chemotaxis protein CheW
MSDLHVLFSVGEAVYALPASTVIQMESFTGATPVPGSPPYVAGLVQVRGAVIPVIDLRSRFGLPPIARELEARMVVVEREGRKVALLADGARRVARIAAGAFAPPPDAVVQQSARFVKAVAQIDGQLVLLIDCDRVIGEGDIHD